MDHCMDCHQNKQRLSKDLENWGFELNHKEPEHLKNVAKSNK